MGEGIGVDCSCLVSAQTLSSDAPFCHATETTGSRGMSIGTSVESETPEWESIRGSAPARPGDRSQTDAHLVEAARSEIQQLASQINRLSGEDLEPEAFFTGFLQRVVSALASVAGAVWQLEPGDEPYLTAQVNLESGCQGSPQQTAIQQPEHTQLLQQVVESNQSFSIPPGSGVAGILQCF